MLNKFSPRAWMLPGLEIEIHQIHAGGENNITKEGKNNTKLK